MCRLGDYSAHEIREKFISKMWFFCFVFARLSDALSNVTRKCIFKVSLCKVLYGARKKYIFWAL